MEQEIGFNPQAVAEVLCARAEKPSGRFVQEAKELGIDLRQANMSEIFLYNEYTGIEQILAFYPNWRAIILNTRINLQRGGLKDVELSTLYIPQVKSVRRIIGLRHVKFISQLGFCLDLWPDCKHTISQAS